MGTDASAYKMEIWKHKNKLKWHHVMRLVGATMVTTGFWWRDTALIVSGGAIMAAPVPTEKPKE